jgi:hypothetical protein
MSLSRYRRFDGFGATAVPALLVCALLVGASLAGCGGTSSDTPTQASTPTGGLGAGSTNTAGASSPGASKAASTARRRTAHAKASASKPAASKPAASNSTVQAPAPVGGRLLRRFTGAGATRLGTIVASSSQVLVWKTQHPAIQIFTANRFLLVSSHASSGSVVLRRGKYTSVRVASRSGWTIELRARS